MDIGFNLGVVVVCMAIVFLVLIGLCYVIVLQKKIIQRFEGNGRIQNDTKIAPAAVQNTYEDEELIAVITAAVAASLGRQSSGIVVRSIRRIGPDALPWAVSGRQDQINSRF